MKFETICLILEIAQSISVLPLSNFLPNTSTNCGSTESGVVVGVIAGKVNLSRTESNYTYQLNPVDILKGLYYPLRLGNLKLITEDVLPTAGALEEPGLLFPFEGSKASGPASTDGTPASRSVPSSSCQHSRLCERSVKKV